MGSIIPRQFPWLERFGPWAVARTTLDALERKATVRPGWLSKAPEASLAPLPRALRARILEIVMQEMTKHQEVAS